MPRKSASPTVDSTDIDAPHTPNNTPNNTPMPSPTPIPDLTLWQAKTLKNTPKRTPLPSSPHSRPWVGLKGADLKRAVNKTFSKARKDAKIEAEEKKKKSLQVKPATTRRVWLKEEIEKLAEMRENGASWEELKEVFPMRTDEGLKQVWWKHKYRRNKMDQQQRDPSMSTNSEIDMDIDADSFSKDGKVRWNFKRKAS